MRFKLSTKQKKWLGFASVVSSIALIFTDQSILPVAIPTIQSQLHASSAQAQWMINAYFLSMSLCILAAGKIADIIGHRRIFFIGLSIFLVASFCLAMSMNSAWLISFRFVQGIGAAMMIPSSFTILLDLFPASQRGLAVGINAAVGSFFLALAPYVGGFFTQYLSWRWVFWINIPICALGQFFGILAVPVTKPISQKFDFGGYATFSLFMLCLIFMFMQAKLWGWFSPGIILLFVFSIIFFLFFLFILKKSKNPFVDFSLFKNSTFSISCFLTFFGQISNGATIFWAMYFQSLFGFEPSIAGFAMLLMAVPIMVMAPVGGKLLDRYSAKVPVSIGLFLLLFAFIWFIFFVSKASILILLPSLLALGWGYTFVLSPALAVGITAVANTHRGMATGVLGTLRNSGLTIGIAIVGALLLNVQHHIFSKDLRVNKLTSMLDPNSFDGLLSKAPKALEAFNKLSSDAQNIVHSSYYNSSLFAFLLSNGFSILIILVAMLWFFKRMNTLKKHKLKT